MNAAVSRIRQLNYFRRTYDGYGYEQLDYPVIKTSSSILAITHDDVEKWKQVHVFVAADA